MLHAEALVSACSGKSRAADGLSRHAVDLARQAGQQERAAVFIAGSAVREAFLGDSATARTKAAEALPLSKGRDVEYAVYPAYARGKAYLATHRGPEAVTEFQKILDHRGIVGIDPVGTLAHLQLGRAYELSGNRSKARSAYQDFLSLWKDADPDIPILKQAKIDYAKLE